MFIPYHTGLSFTNVTITCFQCCNTIFGVISDPKNDIFVLPIISITFSGDMGAEHSLPRIICDFLCFRTYRLRTRLSQFPSMGFMLFSYILQRCLALLSALALYCWSLFSEHGEHPDLIHESLPRI